MMNSLKNKVAIVTDASSGIGYATAKLFAREGVRVIVAARRQQELDTLIQEVTQAGGDAKALAGDVTREDYAKALVDLAIQEYGGLDIGFNNAGTLGASGPTPEITLEAWKNTIDTNLNSAFLGAKYQIPAMLKCVGSLIFTSSFVGYTVGMPQKAAYVSSFTTGTAMLVDGSVSISKT